MAKRRRAPLKSIPMKIGNDPALWRYASLHEALEANTYLLTRLIRAGEEQAQIVKCGDAPAESVPVSVSAQ